MDSISFNMVLDELNYRIEHELPELYSVPVDEMNVVKGRIDLLIELSIRFRSLQEEANRLGGSE